MHGSIQSPSKGERPKASWARAVTDVCNAMRTAGSPGMLQRDGAGAFGASPVPANQRNRRGAAKPLPYEVAWDASLEDGAGGWRIYMPTEHLLMVGTDYVVPDGASEIPDVDGWMTLDEIETDSDHVWLNVTINTTGPSSAKFEAEDNTDTSTGIIGICIAEIEYDEERKQATVKQSAVGEIVLPTGGSGSGSGGGEAYPPELEEVEFVGDIKYDVNYHQLMKRVDKLNLNTGAVTKGDWEMITGGQAINHADLH